MKILFITDRNLTHDIRVFNELMFASSLGHKTELIAFYDQWCEQIEKVHLELAKPRHSYYLKLSNAYYSKAVSQLTKLLYPLMKKNLWVNAFSLDYRTALIWMKLKNLPKDYDLIVAHGFNSLYPAYFFAQKNKTQFAFDAASFVPELENTDYDIVKLHKNKLLFKNIIPFASYYSYATELIGIKLKKVLDGKDADIENFSLANSYPENFFTFRPSVSDKIEFVWIGQKIDLCPDLEMIIPTLYRFKDKVRLHIFGETTERFKNTYSHMGEFLVIHEPMPVDLLLKTIASYDIGLATYLTYVSPEKNYTLSNKIYAFAQNGLYTLASDTTSQRIFFSENPDFGKIVLPNIDNLTEAIFSVLANINKIREEKEKRFRLAKLFSWKYESQKLIKAWSKIENQKNESSAN